MSDFSAILSPINVSQIVTSYLTEDIPAAFDVGGFVVGAQPITANLYMKQSGVFAGKAFFDAVFTALGCTVTWSTAAAPTDSLRSDGGNFATEEAVEGHEYTYAGTPICLAVVEGPCNQILRGERTALCILSRCSGVATDARELTNIAVDAGWKGRVAGTRKVSRRE